MSDYHELANRFTDDLEISSTTMLSLSRALSTTSLTQTSPCQACLDKMARRGSSWMPQKQSYHFPNVGLSMETTGLTTSKRGSYQTESRPPSKSSQNGRFSRICSMRLNESSSRTPSRRGNPIIRFSSCANHNQSLDNLRSTSALSTRTSTKRHMERERRTGVALLEGRCYQISYTITFP